MNTNKNLSEVKEKASVKTTEAPKVERAQREEYTTEKQVVNPHGETVEVRKENTPLQTNNANGWSLHEQQTEYQRDVNAGKGADTKQPSIEEQPITVTSRLPEEQQRKLEEQKK